MRTAAVRVRCHTRPLDYEHMSACPIGGCERPAWCRGLCTAHYFRLRRTGDVRADLPISARKRSPTCVVEGCERDTYARAMCEMHYRRMRRNGDPLVVLRSPEPKECSVAGCDERAEARGWCHGHLQRWLRKGDVVPHDPLVRRKYPATCTIEGCERPARVKGLCKTHYGRTIRYGDALPDLPIKIVTGNGSISHGYRNVPVPLDLRHLVNGETQVIEHRLVMAQHLGRSALSRRGRSSSERRPD